MKAKNSLSRILPFLLLAGFLMAFSAKVQAQKWKYYRHEVSAYVGATNFLGELGGSDVMDPQFYHFDLDFKATRPSFGLSYGYKLYERVNLRLNLNYAFVSGSDEFTENIYRRVRNLSFRSTIYEAGTQVEYYWLKEKTGASFRLRGIRSAFFSNISGYVFAGAGAIYFNPQAQYNGQWVDLAPLNTEGQGLPDADGNIIPDYNQYTLILNYGAGFRYHFNRQWSVSIEYSARNTFSDYIDDVSTNYYDNATLRAQYGDASADLADRNVLIENPDFDASQIEGNELTPNLSWTGTNQQRGNPASNDYYMYGVIGVHYKFLKGRSIKPRF